MRETHGLAGVAALGDEGWLEYIRNRMRPTMLEVYDPRELFAAVLEQLAGASDAVIKRLLAQRNRYDVLAVWANLPKRQDQYSNLELAAAVMVAAYQDDVGPTPVFTSYVPAMGDVYLRRYLILPQGSGKVIFADLWGRPSTDESWAVIRGIRFDRPAGSCDAAVNLLFNEAGRRLLALQANSGGQPELRRWKQLTANRDWAIAA